MPENDNAGVAMLMVAMILFIIFTCTENIMLLLVAIMAAFMGFFI